MKRIIKQIIVYIPYKVLLMTGVSDIKDFAKK
jgi:hypothetical protein